MEHPQLFPIVTPDGFKLTSMTLKPTERGYTILAEYEKEGAPRPVISIHVAWPSISANSDGVWCEDRACSQVLKKSSQLQTGTDLLREPSGTTPTTDTPKSPLDSDEATPSQPDDITIPWNVSRFPNP